MILKAYEQFLTEPRSLWLANCNKDNVPEILRATGLAPFTDYTTITVYISQVYSKQFLQNVRSNPHIALTTSQVITFESYQFKGEFLSLRDCTAEDIERQKVSLDGVTDMLAAIGFSKYGFYNAYFQQPSQALTMSIIEVFEQTPRKGTGTLINKKGEL